MGVDTHLYLLNYDRYRSELVPAFDRLLLQHDANGFSELYRDARQILEDAAGRLKFPWTPLHSSKDPEEIELVVKLFQGYVPEKYFGDRALLETEFTITERAKVREYFLRDKVVSVIVEGLAVPWSLRFPPVHEITWGKVWELYRISPKFEDSFCADVYTRCTTVPYEIVQGDELINQDLIAELWAETQRICPPGSELWDHEYFRNLYLILQKAIQTPGYRILASYF